MNFLVEDAKPAEDGHGTVASNPEMSNQEIRWSRTPLELVIWGTADPTSRCLGITKRRIIT